METRGFVESGRFETGSIYTILNRMEKHELLTSKKMKGDSGRIRRVYNITEEGEKTLVKGLRSIIQWKKVTEELVEYYEEQFNDYETTPDMKHEDNHPNKKKLI
ncbi:MAG: PadR family transcriptional regulator [Candidatus Bathyarchaeota archaeon]